jgi:hypothetical protein
MFEKIENAIIKILQENIKNVPKENIGKKILDFKVEKNLPAISLTNVDFEIKEIGIGRAIGDEDKELLETLSGNGEKKEISLQKLGQVVVVEHPIGKKLKENEDYVIDYEKGVISFTSIPKKGRNNILIKYLKAAEIKGLKFNLRYHLKIYAKDEAQRDTITVNVIETLLREEEELNRQGIFIKPVKGFNAQEIAKDIYGKTLEYQVETTFEIETPFPRIKKIEVERS